MQSARLVAALAVLAVAVRITAASSPYAPQIVGAVAILVCWGMVRSWIRERRLPRLLPLNSLKKDFLETRGYKWLSLGSGREAGGLQCHVSASDSNDSASFTFESGPSTNFQRSERTNILPANTSTHMLLLRLYRSASLRCPMFARTFIFIPSLFFWSL